MDPTLNATAPTVTSDADLVTQQADRLLQNLQQSAQFNQALQDFQRGDTILSIERNMTSKLSNDIDQAIQRAAQ